MAESSAFSAVTVDRATPYPLSVGQSITPAMTVTIVRTGKVLTMIPSVTTSETPPMGVGVFGSDRTITLEPD